MDLVKTTLVAYFFMEDVAYAVTMFRHQKSMYDLPLPLSGLDEDGVEEITTLCRPLRLQRQLPWRHDAELARAAELEVSVIVMPQGIFFQYWGRRREGEGRNFSTLVRRKKWWAGGRANCKSRWS
jgi:hypothetical protein